MRRPRSPLPGFPFPSASRLSRRTARSVPRLLGELVVVFVGVYGAFALSEYQQERERSLRRDQLRQALMEEIGDITYSTRNVGFVTARMRVQFDSLHAAGAMPPLQPIMEPIRVNTHMWDAALASGALDLLDVPTMYRMSRFYNQLNAGFEQFAQLRHLSESMILPNAGDPAAFYDPDTQRLRPQFAWYTQGMERLENVALGATQLGEQLAEELERATPHRARAAHAALEADAQRHAEAFLELIDRKEVQQSWAAIAPVTQGGVPLEQWDEIVRARMAWSVESREVKHRRFHADKIEGADYVSFQFETQPSVGRARLESVSMARQPGEGWKVINYVVQ